MRTAAKVIKLSRSVMPAPAYTDYMRIFVAAEANDSQERILISHEQAHIWLNHRTRRPEYFGTDNFDKKIWEIALEMEIARCIYTESDEDEIKKPLTLLSGGFVSDSFKSMPEEIFLAEDIYEWLKANPQEMERNKNKKFCSCPKYGDEKEGNEKTCKSTSIEEIDNVRREVEKLSETLSTEAKKTKAQNIVKRKPSLVSEMDFVFRNRKQRKHGYLRPSRRESDPFIFKGIKKQKKRPKVEIYVDRSGSMSGEKTSSSIKKLSFILSRYRATVKNDVFYFSNGKIYNHDVPPNGGNPYPLVMAHIEKSRPSIAIIITDYDLEETLGLSPLSHSETKILCVPVCAEHTAIANLIGAIDVF